MDETAQPEAQAQEACGNPFYAEWAAQNKKRQDAVAESSPLKQTGSAVVFAAKADNFRNQFIMNKKDAVIGKLQQNGGGGRRVSAPV